MVFPIDDAVAPIKFLIENILSNIRAYLGIMLVLFIPVNRGYCGGGPETTLLIVNGDSPLSLTVANKYVNLRYIPHNHIVWLHGLPSLTEISVDTFRSQVWEPIHDFIIENDLHEEIDIIAYSADFPYAVNFDSDLKYRGVKLKPPLSRIASLTGFTFYAQLVANRRIGYLNARSNHYYRYNPSGPGSTPNTWTEKEKKIFVEADRALENKEYVKAEQTLIEYTDKRPKQGDGWYKLALIFAQQNKGDEALDALSRAADTGYPHVLGIDREKAFDAYRKDPRFIAAVEKMWETDVGLLPPLGFKHANYTWASSLPLSAGSHQDLMNRYYLSVMLAYTGERGNNLEEIYTYLGAAAASDDSHPDGTVYLMNNENIRSTTRQPLFPATVTALRRLGHKVEMLSSKQKGQNGLMPLNKQDVMGIVAGTANFNWKKTNSRFIPGAIAESLTSFGAKFSSPKQTKLTEFLRHGAAGSSGTVAEPYAVREKFPIAFLHAFYAAGCSLAEAFYQSLATPYQLLIVGDPLARPFATFAEIQLGAEQKPTVKGVKTYLPKIVSTTGNEAKSFELWVDGQLIGKSKPGEALQWDTRDFADGDHEVRLVGEGAEPIGIRSYLSVWQTVRNRDHQVQVIDYDRQVRLDQLINIWGRAENADKIEVRQGARILKALALNSADWKTKINANRLGLGPVTLSVRASYPDGSSNIYSPLDIEIGLPNPLKGRASSQEASNGLVLQVTDSQSETHRLKIIPKNDRVDFKKALHKHNIRGPIRNAQISGRFPIEKSGFYQFGIKTDGKISVEIDEHLLLPATRPSRGQMLFIPMNLQEGWHDVTINLSHDAISSLKIQIAGTLVSKPLFNKSFKHIPMETNDGVRH